MDESDLNFLVDGSRSRIFDPKNIASFHDDMEYNPLSVNDQMRLMNPRKHTLMNNLLLALKDSDKSRVDEILNQKEAVHFKSSGLPLKVAIENGNYQMAKDLMYQGFILSPTLMFDAVKANSDELASNIIKFSFYPEDIIDLMFWFLVKKNKIQLAKELYQNEDSLKVICSYEDIENPEAMNRICNNEKFLESAIDCSLKIGCDEAACMVIQTDFQYINTQRVQKAIDTGCTNFLKILWSGDAEGDPDNIANKKLMSPIWDHCTNLSRISENEEAELRNMFKASVLLSNYLEEKKYHLARKILEWPSMHSSPKILRIITTQENEELAIDYLDNCTINLTSEYFSTALASNKYNICLAMLRRIKSRLDIKSKVAQKKLISLLESSETCLLSIEILTRINIRIWNFDLTRELCIKLNSLIKKKMEIIYVSSPLVFCVLVCETMKKLGDSSSQYRGRCFSTLELYISLACSIQEAITEETCLKFYMSQKDTRDRTVFEIIAKNQFFELLENDDIGIMVTKLWIGSENYYGLTRASSIATTVFAPYGSEESLQFQKGMDLTKPYVFQLARWKDACSSRFLASGISILFLIIIYQVLLYTLIADNSLAKIKYDKFEGRIFRIIELMIFGIACEQLVILIFTLKTRGRYTFNWWKFNDWCISILIVFIAAEIPTTLYEKGIIYESTAKLDSGILHSIMIFLLCTKYISIIMTSDAFGPFLSMTLLIFKEIFTFFVIFICFGMCSSACFTLLFRDIGDKSLYSKLDYSARTLFMATIGPFDISVFDTHPIFGPILLAIFLLIGHVLMLNLLVGIVTNVFNIFQTRIASEHRSVIIRNYFKNIWSDDYGMLIFVPTPFTAISLLFSPFVLIPKNPKIWNSIITNILYLVYAIPYFCAFICVSLISLPFAYILGFLIYGKTGSEVPEKKGVQIFQLPSEPNEIQATVLKFSILKSFAWTVIGIPWLFYAFFVDCYRFWIAAYMTTEIEEDNYMSIVDNYFVVNLQKALLAVKGDLVTPEELFNCFDFFNKLEKQDNQDLNSEYLEFFRQLGNPRMDYKIQINKIKALFPAKTGDVYDQNYISRVRYYSSAWLNKGVTIFQRKIGTMQQLRKMKLESSENTKPFDIEIEKVEAQVDYLRTKSAEILEKMKELSRI
ncbi:hypothetical protein SteCoe_23489 [Stentor coeruleus]|uniref:Ion transport domain-containing protein n=1 Tax=Stentor coeruleus TaxID=5963 RepID=A0A1R2BJR6_9CILI|nr:hypothetical protein SteCoe_23489 [Stentor coeruleus]